MHFIALFCVANNHRLEIKASATPAQLPGHLCNSHDRVFQSESLRLDGNDCIDCVLYFTMPPNVSPSDMQFSTLICSGSAREILI